MQQLIESKSAFATSQAKPLGRKPATPLGEREIPAYASLPIRAVP
jgi:hypothetical protein